MDLTRLVRYLAGLEVEDGAKDHCEVRATITIVTRGQKETFRLRIEDAAGLPFVVLVSITAITG